MSSAHSRARRRFHTVRETDAQHERLALAILVSALLHVAIFVLARVPIVPPVAFWLPELRPLSVVDVPVSGHQPEDVRQPAAETIAALAAFREEADVRVAAMERQLTTDVAQRAQAAREQADALAAEIAREQAERARLAEQAGALEQTLASRDAALAAAEARAAQAEHDAEEARRRAADAVAWKAAYDDLERTFHREIAAREVALQRLAHGVSLSISDRILFASGAAEVSTDGARILDRVAGVLQRTAERRARIEGHTDDVPIGPALRTRYASNWELSTARATEVVRYLVTRGVSPWRLSAAGHADTRPVTPNSTEEGRAQNRRIEIVLVPEPGKPDQPLPGGA